MRKRVLSLAILASLQVPAVARAWGYEGHEIVAAIAMGFVSPAVRAKVQDILAQDNDDLTKHDVLSRAAWADAYRKDHRETANWHFVDIELDNPDLAAACFNFPAPGVMGASHGPANDCIVDKIDEFAAELKDPKQNPSERLLALKFLLHFVGDLHQPLHAADNHDHGGNCVQIALGGSRSTNLHSFWDTAVVEALGTEPVPVAQTLFNQITAAQKVQWEQGTVRDWAQESFAIAREKVYAIGSKPGCDSGQGPITLPTGYADEASKVAALQLEKAGVRLALLLNRSLA